jgi:hypothetical protein
LPGKCNILGTVPFEARVLQLNVSCPWMQESSPDPAY